MDQRDFLDKIITQAKRRNHPEDTSTPEDGKIKKWLELADTLLEGDSKNDKPEDF